MLFKIEETYKGYNEIYNSIDAIISIQHNEMMKTLLENSLYLSTFTVFEEFLNNIIEHYLDNICKEDKGIKFTELSNGIACAMFLGKEGLINNIFKSNKKDKQAVAFDSYLKFISNNLTKDDLTPYIHFEFLHENKLNGYYKDIFEQLIGERDFLANIKLQEDSCGLEDLIDVKVDAFTFLKKYVAVRNSIAHENQKFKVEGFSSFNKVTDSFLYIMKEIIKKYEEHTGFKFEEYEKNSQRDILSDF